MKKAVLLLAVILFNFSIYSQKPCPETPTVTYAGKTYNTVQIGEQCWLKENLDVGTMIQRKSDQTDNGKIEKYCYEDKPENCDKYGGLYQWNEVMQYSKKEKVQGLCPSGWHIPTKEEFEALKTVVNNSSDALLAVGQRNGTNTSGFSALLAGLRGSNGGFYDSGGRAGFWSSTEYNADYAYYMYLRNFYSTVFLDNYGKTYGFSARCSKDS